MVVTLGGSLLVMIGRLEEGGAVVEKATLEFPFERLTPEEVSKALAVAVGQIQTLSLPPPYPDGHCDG